MSAGVDTIDNISLENAYNFRLDDLDESFFKSISIHSSSVLVELSDTLITSLDISNDQTPGQDKKKKKRIRSRKKNRKKVVKEEMVDVNEDGIDIPSNKISIVLSIQAIRSQNSGIVFRKRNAASQYINFDYLTGYNETYMFDSRDFVKLEVLNESVVQINNKSTSRNGTINKNNKSKHNQVETLQTSVSQRKARKKKHKKSVSDKEEKVVQFNEYLSLEDVQEKIKLNELVKGTIRINPKNHNTAYVCNEDRNSQDYIITSTVDRNRALEGDIVALQLKSEEEWVGNQKSASVVHILEKIHPRIAIGSLGLLYNKGRKHAALQPRDKRIPRIVVHQTSLPPMFLKNATDHEDILFMAQITEWSHPKYAEGVITQRIGTRDDFKNETLALLLENQLDVTPFPPTINKYLPKANTIPEEEFAYREDLRKNCIFTIDPLTARDLDDAVSCKTLPNGNLEVGVHIADVTFFLDENTELDEIVSKKATTIYLVDNVYHMLPVELCLHCSLLPGKDCLAFSVFFEMTEDGEILSTRFARTIINSCCQLAYEHAQHMIDNKDSLNADNLPDIYNGYAVTDLCDIVNKLQGISANLRRKRFENGALRVDQVKILFRLNAEGEPVDFFKYENIEAHRLIEELMLLANITVARKILQDFPKIAFLRSHQPPNPRLVKEVQEILINIGIHIDVSSSGAIQSSLEKYSTSDYFGVARNTVLNHLFAKPMNRARYFCASLEEKFEHYALSVDTYTHFTSPIRRYADIMVHRLLAASLGYSTPPQWDVDYVREIAFNCNTQKYNAKKAGEASSDMFLAHYIETNQPFIQDAVVIDVREQSFHVIVLSTGSVVRIYLNNLGEGVKCTSEKVGETDKILWRAAVTYPNDTRQIIEMFQIVKVNLKRKGKTFSLEGQLIQPE